MWAHREVVLRTEDQISEMWVQPNMLLQCSCLVSTKNLPKLPQITFALQHQRAPALESDVGAEKDVALLKQWVPAVVPGSPQIILALQQ